MNLGIAGRTALISGGSRGLGLACAHALAAEGVQIGLFARTRSDLDDAAAAIRAEHPVKVTAVVGDTASAADIERAVESVIGELGSLDILVNNASPRVWGLTMDDVPDEVWLRFWQEKVMAYGRFMRAVAPGMRLRKWGRIVNMAGMGGRNPSRHALPGGMAQMAVLNLTKAVSDDYGPDGITVNAISPGAIATGAQENAGPKGSIFQVMAREGDITEDEARTRFLAGISLRRFGTADEVADLVLFLASERAAYITGANFTIDGGRSKSIV